MTALNHAARRFSPALRPLVLALAVGLLAAMLGGGVLHRLELFTGDVLFRLRGPLHDDSGIVLVAIDDASFAHNDLQWPWPRSYLARIVDSIAAGDPSVIVVDVQFYEPSTPEEDARLAEAIREAGNVVLVSNIATERRQGVVLRQLNQPIRELREAAAAVGLAQFQRDDDGTLRRMLAFARHNGKLYPSLAMEAARMHLGVERFFVASPDDVWIGAHHIRLDDQYLPVNFRGPAEMTIPYYSAYQVADGLVDPAVFTGRIVIIGATAETIPLYDSYPTPFGSSPPMSGAEANAHAIDTILHGRPLRPASWLAQLGVSLAAALAAGVLARWVKPLTGLALVVVLALAYLVLSWALFAYARVIPPLVGPSLALALVYVAGTTVQVYDEQRQRARVRALFERYVSPAAIDEMLSQPDSVSVSGQRRDVTVMFSDIRGFTALSEKLRPEEVVAILNDYLGAMTEIIFKYGGTVDKFEGDGILAIWNAPLAVEDHPTRAVECALEMTRRLAEMQQGWTATGQQALKSGIGISTGPCFVGNIGSSQRMDYTVIGDTVNLAARLEALTKELGLQIVYSEATHRQLAGHIRSRFVTSAKVAGREQPVNVYTVLGVDEPQAAQPEAEAAPARA